MNWNQFKDEKKLFKVMTYSLIILVWILCIVGFTNFTIYRWETLSKRLLLQQTEIDLQEIKIQIQEKELEEKGFYTDIQRMYYEKTLAEFEPSTIPNSKFTKELVE